MRSRRETALAAWIADRFLVVTHIRRDDGAASHPELRKRAAAAGPEMKAMNAAAAAGSLLLEATAAA